MMGGVPPPPASVTGALPPPAFPSSVAMTPPAAPGLTNSVPVNLGAGGALIGGTNYGTVQMSGNPQVAFFAGGLMMGVNALEQAGWLDTTSKRHAAMLIIGLLAGGLAIGIVAFVLLGHLDPVEGLSRGCGIAIQAWANHLGLKVTGLPSMAGAPGQQMPAAAPSIPTGGLG